MFETARSRADDGHAARPETASPLPQSGHSHRHSRRLNELMPTAFRYVHIAVRHYRHRRRVEMDVRPLQNFPPCPLHFGEHRRRHPVASSDPTP